MQYMLLIAIEPARMGTMTDKERADVMGAYLAYTEAMQKEGAWIAGNRLEPSANAHTVRMADGRSQVLNGPYAETREQLAGYYLIEAADLDAAQSWAARCPGARFGAVEVRPVWAM
jgi:hypothetical protein